MIKSRKFRCYAGASLFVLAVIATNSALAECISPGKGEHVVCSDSDDNGVTLSSPNSTLTLTAGAVISSSNGPAVIVNRRGNNYPSDANSIAIDVDGTITGGNREGIRFIAGEYDPAASDVLIVRVGRQATVTGDASIRLVTGGYQYASMNVNVENSGSIVGAAGYAILDETTEGASAYFRVTNTATGSMNAIKGLVYFLDNAGSIDGSQRSAIDLGIGDNYAPQATLTNSGRIVSNSSAATLAGLGAGATFNNSGTIVNSASGGAIDGYYYAVNNFAGSVIGSSGTLAIGADQSLSLVNAGTINGDVVIRLAPTDQGVGSIVDSSTGIVNGNLELGGGHDRLVATVGPDGLHTGFTGTIDSGAGYDTLDVHISTDVALGMPLALPGFDVLLLNLKNDAVVTLADGFTLAAPLRLEGPGSVINKTDLSFSGTDAISGNGSFGSAPSFQNEGHITVNAGGPYNRALQFGGASFDNTGLIEVQGNGLALYSADFTNSGTIQATGRTVSVDSNGLFSNGGTIRSTADIALTVDYGSYSTLQNTGIIEGAKAAVLLNGTLRNDGLLSSPQTAVASYGDLINDVHGVITGGTAAIGPVDGNVLLASSIIVNAGTINGDVVLIRDISYDGGGNTFIAQPGGVLNGNLTLGRNDTLAVNLPTAGSSPFTGFNGAINANGARLRFRASTDSAATLAPMAGFGSVSFEVLDGARLALRAEGAVHQSIVLAGNGTIDLTADLSVDDDGGLIFATPTLMPGESYSQSNLAVVSHGTLSALRSGYGAYPTLNALAALGNNDSFINAGTLIFRSSLSDYSLAAVRGGTSFVNDGTILLDGTTGYSGNASVENHGTITQVEGGAVSIGIASASLVNSGTISVAGTAVISGATIQNEGLLRSTGGAAISGPNGVTLTNVAAGTIQGDGVAIHAGTSKIVNAGLILGTVDLRDASIYYGSLFTSDGGTVQGDLLFGGGNDIFLHKGDETGISGVVDGGDGIDIYGRSLSASATVGLGPVPGLHFERQMIQASGADTILTIQSSQAPQDGFLIGGDGHIINGVQTAGAITSFLVPDPFDVTSGTLTAFTNEADIGGFSGRTHAFSNSAMINAGGTDQGTVYVAASDRIAFVNTGQIHGGETYDLATNIYGSDFTDVSVINQGVLDGRLALGIDLAPAPATVTIVNAGTIEASRYDALEVEYYSETGGATLSIANSGRIEALGGGTTAVNVTNSLNFDNFDLSNEVVLSNSGIIRANGGGKTIVVDYLGDVPVTTIASAVQITAYDASTATIANVQGALIEATGEKSSAILGATSIDLNNAGEINGRSGSNLAADDLLTMSLGTTYLAGAIQSVGGYDDTVTNSGTIRGDIDLNGGSDNIINSGTIIGNVYLRDGDDSFTQFVTATLEGTVDGGAGTDSLFVNAAGGGTLNADQFVNFERVRQVGAGDVSYTGSFAFDTIGLDGGTITVAAGQTLSSAGADTVTGGLGSDTVLNDGTITGSVDLGGGDDVAVNAGQIGGSILLGAGNDNFTEKAGSRVSGGVDGGIGTDVYHVVLAGDRSSIGKNSGFEQMAVEGMGTLTMTLDQSWEVIGVAGADLDLTTNGQFVAQLIGSAAMENVTLSGAVATISLAGGNDLLEMSGGSSVGNLDGGAGNDRLHFLSDGPVVLSGKVTGFEDLSLASGSLKVTGQLGSDAAALRFSEAGETLELAAGGVLVGQIDMVGGDDHVQLSKAALWRGSLSGGEGIDSFVLAGDGDAALEGSRLSSFEELGLSGSGIVTLSGAFSLQKASVEGDLTIGSGAVVSVPLLSFGATDNTLTIAGAFDGSVDGGAGTNRLMLASGTANDPVRLGSVASMADLTMTGGYTTISGQASFSSVNLTGGRLVGLTGSIIGGNVGVALDATFGSAGTINGNITVNGRLSPGASPGTMTVNGNVVLNAGSNTLFEFQPTVSDALIINGSLTIATGAKLTMTGNRPLTPGVYTMVDASGGITGTFGTNVTRDSTVLGVLSYTQNTIDLISMFQLRAGASTQVVATNNYLNDLLLNGAATSSILSAFPVLVNADGYASPAVLSTLSPEPYASAAQMGIENGLAIAWALRNVQLAGLSDDGGLFVFGQAYGHRRTFDGDVRGTANADVASSGYLGGAGFGNSTLGAALFVGKSDIRQHLRPLGARNEADGLFFGGRVHYAAGGFAAGATVIFDRAKADTERSPATGGTARSHYDLRGTTLDGWLSYGFPVGEAWKIGPQVGITHVSVKRGAINEAGGGAFALNVARQIYKATFLTADLKLEAPGFATLRPWAAIGIRYRLQSDAISATGGFTGTGASYTVAGVDRKKALPHVGAGIDVSLSQSVSLFVDGDAEFSGRNGESHVNGGITFRF